MSEYRIQESIASAQAGELQACANEIQDIAGSVRDICRSLSIEGSSKQTLQFKLNKIADNVSLEGVHAGQMSSVLSQAIELYRRADQEGREVADGAEDSPQNGTGAVPTGSGGGGNGSPYGAQDSGESSSWLAKMIENMFGDLSPIMDFLDEIMDTEEGAFGGALLAWIKGWKDFFENKARGLMGGSALCDIADASFTGWKAVYDWFYEKFKNGGGIFTDGWNTGVHAGAVVFSLFGFGGDLLEAISKGEGQDLLNRLANYLDCGGSLFDVGADIYQLKNIGDKINIPAYLWGSFVECVTGTGSQLLRSISEYSQDGHLDLGDVASTGVDIGVAGLYSMIHALTFGGDLWLVNQINDAAGRERVTGEEYVQAIQDGLRQWASDVGQTPIGQAYVNTVDTVINSVNNAGEWISNAGRRVVSWLPFF